MPLEVYICFAVNGDRGRRDEVRLVMEHIEARGDEVLTKHLVADDPWERWRDELGPDVDPVTRNRHIRRTDLANVDRATHIIAELSGVSTGVGVEIGYAIGKFGIYKPTLYVFHCSAVKHVTPMAYVDPIEHSQVQMASYEDVPQLLGVVDRFLYA